MKCPSCRAKIKGDENYCNKCRFMVPGAKYFANGGSFSEWKSQIKQKGSQQDEPIPVVSAAPESLPEIIPENIPDSAPAARIEPIPAELSPHVPAPIKDEPKVTEPAPAAKPHKHSKPEVSVYRGPILTAFAFTILCSVLLSATWIWDYYVTFYRVSGFKPRCLIIYSLEALVWLIVLIAFLAKKRRKLMTAGLILLAVSGLIECLLWCFVCYEYALWESILAYFTEPLVIINMIELFIPAALLLIIYLKKPKFPWILPAISSLICSLIGIYFSIGSNTSAINNIFNFLHVSFFFAAGRYVHLRDKESQVSQSAFKPALKVSRGRVVTAYILSIISTISVSAAFILTYISSVQYINEINLENSATDFFYLAVWILILTAFLAKKQKPLMILGLLLLSVSEVIQRLITCALWESFTLENYVFTKSTLLYFLELFIPSVLLLFVYFKKTKMLWFLPGWSFAFLVSIHCYTADYFPDDLNFFLSYVPLAFFFIITGRFFYLLKRSLAVPAS